MNKMMKSYCFWGLLCSVLLNIVLMSQLKEDDADRHVQQKASVSKKNKLKLMKEPVAKQDDYLGKNNYVIALNFETRIQTSDLESALTVYDGDKKIQHYFVKNEKNRCIRFKVFGVKQQKLTIKIKAGLYDADLQYQLAHNVELNLPLGKTVQFYSVSPKTNTWETFIRLWSNQQIDLNELKKSLLIEPEIPFYVTRSDNAYRINADFKAASKYVLTIKKGLKSRYNAELKENFRTIVYFPDYKPGVRFKAKGTYMSKGGTMLLPVETVNVDKLSLEVHRVFANNVVHYLWSYELSRFSASPITATIPVNSIKNVKTTTMLDLRKLLNGNKSGVYFVKVLNKDRRYSYRSWDSKLVMLTDIGISVKKSKDELLVWVNRLSNINALSGAKVAVFSKKNQLLASQMTDQFGIAKVNISKNGNDSIPAVIVVQYKHDIAFLELSETCLEQDSFDIGGRKYDGKSYQGFLFTDRGIYRPGESAHFKGLVRDAELLPPGEFPLEITIMKPDFTVFCKKNVILSPRGSFDFDLKLPDNAHTGRYQVKLTVPGGHLVIGSTTFQIEDFMPDRLKVKIKTDSDKYQDGDKAEMIVDVMHLFGSPAASRLVKGSCILAAKKFSPKKWRDYKFSNSKSCFANKVIKLGCKKTGNDGKVAFQLTLPDNLQASSTIKAVFVATAREIGGRAVTSYKAATVFPYTEYLGIKRQNDGYAQVGTPEVVQFCLLDQTGEPVAADKLSSLSLCAEVYDVNWNWVLQENDNGGYEYKCVKDECLAESMKVLGHKGTFSFFPKRAGCYRVVLRNPESGYSTDLEFECGGSDEVSWAKRRPDKLELTCAKKVFNVGEKAEIMLKSSFPGKALVTIEKNKVLDSFVIEVKDKTKTFNFDIKEEYGANVYCSVTLIRKQNIGNSIAVSRAFGIVPVCIDRLDKRLVIDAQVPKKIRPNKSAVFSFNVNDSRGKPVVAELAIALVDAGICQLTGYNVPDPFSYFYGKLALDTRSYDLYSLLMPNYTDISVSQKALAGGGGGLLNRRLFNPLENKRIKNVAFWFPSVKTDQNGVAKIACDIPNFIGSLKIMAVAASNDAFGANETSTKVRSPLMIKSSAPRFLAPKDSFVVPVTFFNKTGQTGILNYKIAFADFKKELSLKFSKNGERTEFFKFDAPEIPGNYDLKIEALFKSGELQERAVSITTIPVRPPIGLTVKSGAGTMNAEKGCSIITLPGGWMKGTVKTKLVFSSLPHITFAKSISSLLDYPYGCLEQTTSRSFPLLYIADIIPLIEPTLADKDKVQAFIQHGVNRILSMQLYNGGFALWPGSRSPYEWGSIYVTHFLLEAKKKGLVIPDDSIKRALTYLKKIQYSNCLNTDAYCTYVLALAGSKDSSHMMKLFEKQDELSEYSKTLLAASLVLAGQPVLADSLLEKAKTGECTERQTGGHLESSVRNNGVMLAAYLDYKPKHKNVAILATRLIASFKKGQWFSTQDNAVGLMAIGKYYNKQKQKEKKYHATIYNGKTELLRFDDSKQVVIYPEGIEGKVLSVMTTGIGNIYYSWQIEGIPLNPEVKNYDKNLSVRRRLLSLKGKSVDLMNIKHGEVYVAEIQLMAGRFVDNIVISDLLPAGFEIENPRIKTRRRSMCQLKNTLSTQHIEPRDDRFLLFCQGADKTAKYYYMIRAVTKGQFVFPPISAQCMYDPEYQSINGFGKVVIK